MSIERAIFTILSTDATVGGYIGIGQAARVYPNEAPEKAQRPYVVYKQITYSEDVQASHVLEVSGFAFYVIPETSIASDNYIVAKDLARAIRLAFRDQNGQQVGQTCIESIRPGKQVDQWLPEITQHGTISTFNFYERATL